VRISVCRGSAAKPTTKRRRYKIEPLQVINEGKKENTHRIML
jgi:hypothetical protein